MTSTLARQNRWHPAEVLLIPLAVLFPLGPRFTSGVGNIHLATIVTFIWLGLWALFVFPGPQGGLSVETAPQKRLFWFLVCLTGVLVLHVGEFSEQPANFLRAIQQLGNMAVFLTVASLRVNPGVARRIMRISLIVLLIECIGTWFVEDWAVFGFLTGSFDGQHNHFSAYLVLMLCLLVPQYSIAGTRSRRVLLGFLIFATVTCLVFTFSRTAYIAAPAALVALATRQSGKRGFVNSLAVIAVLLVIAAVTVPESVRDRFSSIAEATSGGEEGDISFLTRLAIWRESLRTMSWTGYFGDPDTGRIITDNGFFYILTTTGPIGFLLFLAFVVSLARWLWRIYPLQENRELRALALGLFAATVGLLFVMDLAADAVALHRVMGIFWILLGCLVSLQRSPRQP